jgi:hypothetical protein
VKKTILPAGILILSLAAEFGWVRPHGPHHPWDAIPGFYVLFGFAGAAILAAAAKWLGKKLLLKDEDYYDR